MGNGEAEVMLTDDLDGSIATETIQMRLDGVSYEIDLNQANAASLRYALSPFVDSARKTGRGPSRRRRHPAVRLYDPVAVRAWAKSAQIVVAERGRIPAAVIEQYRAAGH